jgi:HD-like signal output (HDOD) protein
MERCLARGELVIPLLPEVALRVVRTAAGADGNAETLADVVSADPALAAMVLKVAGSASLGPAAPIFSVQQAIAWLGFDEVSSIAFTLALQGQILEVSGQHHRIRRLWRHALASGIWAKRLALLLSRDPGIPYLCGLLHDVGRLAAFGAVQDLARRAQVKLGPDGYDRLIETFHHAIGIEVTKAWDLPAPVQVTAAQWQAHALADAARFECALVRVAHRLADATLRAPDPLAWDLISDDPAYLDLGLDAEDAASILEHRASVEAELDRYLTR